jgi:hypothetical protein
MSEEELNRIRSELLASGMACGHTDELIAEVRRLRAELDGAVYVLSEWRGDAIGVFRSREAALAVDFWKHAPTVYPHIKRLCLTRFWQGTATWGSAFEVYSWNGGAWVIDESDDA